MNRQEFSDKYINKIRSLRANHAKILELVILEISLGVLEKTSLLDLSLKLINKFEHPLIVIPALISLFDELMLLVETEFLEKEEETKSHPEPKPKPKPEPEPEKPEPKD